MRFPLLLATATLALAFAGTATAATVTDPTGDFLPSYTGPRQADLDVTSFSVNYDPTAQTFLLQSTLAGPIDPSTAGFYAIGVNTGAGAIRPFGSIGAGNVIFDQVIAVQKDGTATIGATALAAGSVLVGGNAFSVVVPLSLLPSTGFSPQDYGFNLWPRSGAGGLGVISDFAPDDATVSAAAVPEPATWAAMVCGFALMGSVLRKRKDGTTALSAG